MPGGTFADLRLISEMQDNRHAVAMFAADMSADAALHWDFHSMINRLLLVMTIYTLAPPELNRAGFGANTAFSVYTIRRIDYTAAKRSVSQLLKAKMAASM